MADLLQIVDLADSGQVQLSLLGGSGQETAPPADFPLPLTGSELTEIRWYFTEYPENTFGEASNRAEKVQNGLKDLGRLLYEAVFGSSDEARSLLDRATGTGQAQLSIVSTRPEFLGLPWELLNHGDDGYLASNLAGVSRRLSAGPLEAFTGQMPTDQLNVLLLLPPSGEGSGSIATEALAALELLPVDAELDCLRPSSPAKLQEQLAGKSGHYHLVHFDGFTIDGQGICMEDGSGGTISVDAAELAQSLTGARTPVVLVNTSSASALNDVMSFAAGLAQGGVPQVVAAPVPIAGAGRVLFCENFFKGLSSGAPIAQTVAAVRQAMMDHPERPSSTGPLVSWDWLLPLVFESLEYSSAVIKTEDPAAPAPAPVPQPEQESSGTDLPRGGPYGLIGRHAEILELERRFRLGPVVLLSGDVGTGKSELALGLASWLRKTGGRPGGVFYSVFEVGAGLERVLHEIGTALAGLDFADLRAEDRRAWVVDYLNENSALLVFDSLQNLAGFPTGAPGLLDENETADLDSFLKEVAEGGQTWTLLVSRRDQEPWLTVPYGGYRLGGLDRSDRIVLGTRLLEEAGADPMRLGPEYLEVLELVDGHPLAMEIALPLLKDIPASVLVGELRSELGQHQPGADEEGRPAYLTVVMEHAFSRMTRRSRVHLPFLSLFRSRVMLDILTHITQEQAYKSVMGEQLGWGATRTLLRTARGSGFLEPITPSVYQIHPSLPWFYGRSLYRQFSQSAIQQLEQEIVRVYADTADYFMETLYENQEAGTTAILAEEGNITQALALSLEAGQWENAQLLVQPLAQVYRMQKRYPELRRLRRQLLETAGATAEEAEKTGGIDLWLYLMGTEASECIETKEFDRADALNQQLLEYLAGKEDGETDPRTAAVFHQMGQVAQNRWRLEEAQDLFTKSLAIIEGGEDQEPVADDYYGLGLVCQYRRRYTEAKEWFSKALEIHQRVNDAEEMVNDYRSLGLCSQYKFEYDEAASWYQRAREILEENRDEETAVLVYHSLGTVCHAQYQFDEAENWYQQSLTISDRMGNDAQMGIEFHHLGLVEQAREMFVDDAEHWYMMAMEKWRKLGDRRSEGDECRQLGVLFHQQKDLDKAEEWYGRARDVFEEIQDLNRICRTYGQLGMVAEERDDIPGALLWAGRTYQLAEGNGLPVLIQAKSHLARLKDKHGEDGFAAWWRDFAGEDPPSDLDVDPETIL